MAGNLLPKSILPGFYGDKQLIANLRKLTSASAQNRVIRSSINKGLRHLAKSAKKAIPPEYKDIRPMIGSKLDKKGGAGLYRARFGVKVGVKKARLEKLDSKKKSRIKAAIAHLFFVGTRERRKRSTGASTGVMFSGNAPPLKGLIKETLLAQDDITIGIMRRGVQDGIAREVAKLKK